MRFIESVVSGPSLPGLVKGVMALEVLKSLSFIRLQQWLTATKSFIQNNAGFGVADQEASFVLKFIAFLRA